MPDKTDYVLGEPFDPTGLVVNAIMSDGSVEENVSWTVDESLVLMTNTTEIQIRYNGKSVQLPIRVLHPGNVDEYAVANFPTLEDSPLAGRTFFWLGSSVTVGSNALNESMADFIAKKYSCTCIKEAVSGTTLATYKKNSYVERLDAYLALAEKNFTREEAAKILMENYGITEEMAQNDAGIWIDNLVKCGIIEE